MTISFLLDLAGVEVSVGEQREVVAVGLNQVNDFYAVDHVEPLKVYEEGNNICTVQFQDS